jgi:hypothetical protein
MKETIPPGMFKRNIHLQEDRELMTPPMTGPRTLATIKTVETMAMYLP